ncbi:hypothetical protein [Amycolatopsis xylanica]|nr:hypothetical protein [Amycolatopsis xylanica]
MSLLVRRGLAAMGAAALVAGIGTTPAQADEVLWGIGPSPVQPGGQIHVSMRAWAGGCAPGTPVTSPGLVAPIKWQGEAGNFPSYTGTGTVVKKPGKYVATFTCQSGKKASATFVVAGTPAPDPTPTPAKPKPTAKPKPQVAVKPKGAPQTGGGEQ